VQLFSEATELNVLKSSLSVEEINESLVQLYEISGQSKGKLSFNAASLYNNIEQSIKKRS
jgi:hypothetical protein